MLECSDASARLVGPAGSIRLPADDEITRKLAMLVEGQCEGLGPTQAARKFGYTKQRYFQLLRQFEAHGARALQNHPRGPKPKPRRTEELVRQVIRHRFLDPEASAAVIAQKLRQAHYPISIRSVKRVIEAFGLQKKPSTPVARKAAQRPRRGSKPSAPAASGG
jgi:transposase